MSPVNETPGAQVRAMRAEAERRLHAPGKARHELLRKLAVVERELKDRIREAAEVGLTHRHIGEVAQVPHPTVSRWVKEAANHN